MLVWGKLDKDGAIEQPEFRGISPDKSYISPKDAKKLEELSEAIKAGCDEGATGIGTEYEKARFSAVASSPEIDSWESLKDVGFEEGHRLLDRIRSSSISSISDQILEILRQDTFRWGLLARDIVEKMPELNKKSVYSVLTNMRKKKRVGWRKNKEGQILYHSPGTEWMADYECF